MPFGEEVMADATYRTAGHKYGVGDGVRQKFTGYERDEETGLDFAEARYYYNNHGRFTAVDPLLASGKSANPQTFNRYAYTMNRPLILTDPTGLQAGNNVELELDNNCGESCLGSYLAATNTVHGSSGALVDLEVDIETANVPNPIIETSPGLVTNLLMPRIGRGLDERMAAELEAMATEGLRLAGSAIYRMIPDSAEASISLPFYSGGVEVSKDGNLFAGVPSEPISLTG